MENKLNKLFDYQKFSNNKKISKLISQTEQKYNSALSDDELDMVNAAGTTEEIKNPFEVED